MQGSTFYVLVNNFYDDVKPLLIKLPKLKRLIKSFKKVKIMSFTFEEKHETVLSKYFEI